MSRMFCGLILVFCGLAAVSDPSAKEGPETPRLCEESLIVVGGVIPRSPHSELLERHERLNPSELAAAYAIILEDLPPAALSEILSNVRKTDFSSFFLLPASVAALGIGGKIQERLVRLENRVPDRDKRPDVARELFEKLIGLIRLKGYLAQQSSSHTWSDHLIELDPPMRRGALSPDGTRIAYTAGDRSTRFLLRDIIGGVTHSFSDPLWVREQNRIHDDQPISVGWYIDRIAFSPSGDTVFATSESELMSWNAYFGFFMGGVSLGNEEDGYSATGLVVPTEDEVLVLGALGEYMDETHLRIDLMTNTGGVLERSKTKKVRLKQSRPIDASLDLTKKNLVVLTANGRLRGFRFPTLVARRFARLELGKQGVFVSYLGEPDLFVVVVNDEIIIVRDKNDRFEITERVSVSTKWGITAAGISPDRKYLILGSKEGTRILFDIDGRKILRADDSHLPLYVRHGSIPSQNRTGIRMASIATNGLVCTSSFRDQIVMVQPLSQLLDGIPIQLSQDTSGENFLISTLRMEGSDPGLARVTFNNIPSFEMARGIESMLRFVATLDSRLGRLSHSVEQNVSIFLGESFRTHFSVDTILDGETVYAKKIELGPGPEGRVFKFVHELRHAWRTPDMIEAFQLEGLSTIQDPSLRRNRVRHYVKWDETFAIEAELWALKAMRSRGISTEDYPREPWVEALYDAEGIDGIFRRLTEIVPEANLEATVTRLLRQ